MPHVEAARQGEDADEGSEVRVVHHMAALLKKVEPGPQHRHTRLQVPLLVLGQLDRALELSELGH